MISISGSTRGDRDFDRSEWFGKVNDFEKYYKTVESRWRECIFDDTSLLKLPYKELASKMAVVLTDRIKTELMTCHDIVATGRYPYTGRLGILTQEDERLVEEAMQAVHAQELGNRDFNAISDGQKQRVLLARAICQDPDVIVLDEPTSFLDVKYKLELLSILEQMARQKKITVIMSLHEIDLAQKISDKIICVKGETISHYGSPEEVFTEEIIRELYGINNGYFDPLLEVLNFLRRRVSRKCS